ncbi:MAG: hypothetical protein JSS20_03370 [Proteobacteria bacterium]|nr:hypothetical protein [Pseudomonadota bacterium]
MLNVSTAVGIIVVVASLIAPAAAEERRYRSRQYDYDHPHQGRSSTEDRRGRCHRDNGRSIGSLDLKNRCDREEFWARMDERRK